MAVSVHPQAQYLLDGKAASGAPTLWELTPSEARAGVAANAALIGAGPDVASVRDIVIPAPGSVRMPRRCAPRTWPGCRPRT